MKEDAHTSIQDQNFGEPIKPPAKSEVKNSEKAKKSTNIKVVAALITIAVLIGLSIALLIMKANGFFATPESHVATNQPSDDKLHQASSVSFLPTATTHEDGSTTVEYVGEEITDQKLVKDLNYKLAILHRISEFSGTNFTEISLQDVSQRLYGGFSERDKLFMVMEHLNNHSMNWESSPNADPDSITGQFQSVSDPPRAQSLIQQADDFVCTPIAEGEDWCNIISEISAETVNELYRKVFGTAPAITEPIASACTNYLYDPEAKIYYYYTVHGCGGVRMGVHNYYIEKYTQQSGYAHVYIRVGVASEGSYQSSSGAWVHECRNYFDILLIDGPEVPYEVCYEDSLSSPRNSIIISNDNYTKFAPYVFIFKQDDGGNYYFEKIEKLLK